MSSRTVPCSGSLSFLLALAVAVTPAAGLDRDSLGDRPETSDAEVAIPCDVAFANGWMARGYEPANALQAEARASCGGGGGGGFGDRFCVVNVDGDSHGTGFSGVILDGLHEYGEVYPPSTTDDEIRDDLSSEIGANPFFNVYLVGQTSFIIEPTSIGGMGCGPRMEDSSTKVGARPFDWSSIAVVEADPADSPPLHDIETNGVEPWTDLDEWFRFTTFWGPTEHVSGLDSDIDICAGLFYQLPSWAEPVGWTAIALDAAGTSVSCSTSGPSMAIGCRMVEY